MAVTNVPGIVKGSPEMLLALLRKVAHVEDVRMFRDELTDSYTVNIVTQYSSETATVKVVAERAINDFFGFDRPRMHMTVVVTAREDGDPPLEEMSEERKLELRRALVHARWGNSDGT